jgi:hypothetical protein
VFVAFEGFEVQTTSDSLVLTFFTKLEPMVLQVLKHLEAQTDGY